jgi:hypothetical protein
MIQFIDYSESNININRFDGPEFEFDRDAYQIAENTPRSRHDEKCHAAGQGHLVTHDAFPVDLLCSCWVVSAAQKFVGPPL